MTNQTFEQLKKTYESGRTRPLAWRRAQLNALRRLVTENRDAFVSSAMADLGKPAAETVLMELNLVAGEAQFVRNRLSLWTARHPKAMHWMLQPAAGWTIAEPKGVVLIISPWNYPVLLALEPMADALAAGNAVCLKPSELSPNTSKLLAELVPQYLDSEAVRVVEGGPKETGELLKCPFNHIFYTGGGHVGKIVMRAAAEHLTPSRWNSAASRHALWIALRTSMWLHAALRGANSPMPGRLAWHPTMCSPRRMWPRLWPSASP